MTGLRRWKGRTVSCHCNLGSLSPEEAADLRQRLDAATQWLRQHGQLSYDPKDPALPDFVRDQPTNEERSALEVFEFLRDRPEKYFAYYTDDLTAVTTWMGDKLGDIVYRGPAYKVGFWPGATMRRVRVVAITGDRYAGVCNISGGTYCRLKRMK